ncbi:FAD:protein FMN transferase [Mucilaginibacter flavidus]|uniref:FAD:protein FMN transferase n=1 Tax=Mucilaginibacter flavidus TaxID=2949309 RepID=UPI002093AC00|nr:FAD:protein FMN transferase [Mucilaginibacter flavidus]MCO5949028.1 FAD:protein FMN transferase [Mucilaginibacter flavidus]
MLGIVTVHKRVLRLMGNRFEISVVSDDEHWAHKCIDAAVEEISRIEKLLTTFSDDSQTNQVNRNAGVQPIKVDREVYELVERALKISGLTQGAFDISYGGIDKSLWNFDLSMTALPDPEVARESVRLINYNNVILDEGDCTIFLKEEGMRIGFGGIGKGYAADKARALLQNLGVTSGIVNAAGDLVTWGTQPNGKPWTIAIADPDKSITPFSTLNISNMAIATSGNYEKYVMIGGRKYSHTIDPKTGLPVTGIKSVSIISPSAELADAMATPVMVMGVRVGLDLINQLKQIACIVIDDNNQIHCSKNINIKN